jgi:hypothetical protein
MSAQRAGHLSATVGRNWHTLVSFCHSEITCSFSYGAERWKIEAKSSGGRAQMGSEALSSDTSDEVHLKSRLGAIVREHMKEPVARVHTVDFR